MRQRIAGTRRHLIKRRTVIAGIAGMVVPSVHAQQRNATRRIGVLMMRPIVC
jgi:hypothetical protein